MKIMINYDLLDKIKEAKNGVSLQKQTKRILLGTSISTIYGMTITRPIENIFNYIPLYFIAHFALNKLLDKTFEKTIKILSLKELKQLSSQLKDIKVNTNEDLILDSYKYKTEYKWLKSEKDVDLVQNKYIMVPAIENGEEKEISILQEHVIGSKIYSLSIGEPTKQKVFKLSTNPI